MNAKRMLIPTLQVLGVLALFGGAAFFAWYSEDTPSSVLSLPQGLRYQVPGEMDVQTSYWTVVTVRDVSTDRYSFTAFVPVVQGERYTVLDSKGQKIGTRGTMISVLRNTQTRNILEKGLLGGTAFENTWNHSASEAITLRIYRPATAINGSVPDDLNPGLDTTIVPGSMMFVNVGCAYQQPSPTRTEKGASASGTDVSAKDTPSLAYPPPADLATQAVFCRLSPSQQIRSIVSGNGQLLLMPPDTNKPVGSPFQLDNYILQAGTVASQPPLWQRLAVVGMVALSLSLLALVLLPTRVVTPSSVGGMAWRRGGLGALIIGRDGRYSNSQFQAVIWYFIFLTALISTGLLRISRGGPLLAGNILIPPGLLSLTGLSAAVFVGAAAITASNVASGRVTKPPTDRPRLLQDLFYNDVGEFELADFQSALVTMIAAIGYLVILLGYLSSLPLMQDRLPEVDSSILAIFGIGQVAYLAKKSVQGTENKRLGLTFDPASLQFPAALDPAVRTWVTARMTWRAATEALLQKQAELDEASAAHATPPPPQPDTTARNSAAAALLTAETALNTARQSIPTTAVLRTTLRVVWTDPALDGKRLKLLALDATSPVVLLMPETLNLQPAGNSRQASVAVQVVLTQPGGPWSVPMSVLVSDDVFSTVLQIN